MEVQAKAGVCAVLEKDGQYWQSEEVRDQNATFTLGRFGPLEKANIYPGNTKSGSEIAKKEKLNGPEKARVRRVMIVTSFVFED